MLGRLHVNLYSANIFFVNPNEPILPRVNRSLKKNKNKL